MSPEALENKVLISAEPGSESAQKAAIPILLPAMTRDLVTRAHMHCF